MSEQGAASLPMLAVAALVVVLAVGVGDVGLYLTARLQAAAAADAAALAAAPVTFAPFGGSGSPVAEANRFASANGTRLVSCSCPIDHGFDPRTVVVVVERSVTLPGIGTVWVRATSRAEFAPAELLDGEGTTPE